MYYIVISVILLMYHYVHTFPGDSRKKKDTKCADYICVMLVLLAAFRGDAVGADTASYRYDYESMYLYHNLQDLISRYGEFYMGYFVPSKIFHLIGLPVQVWFGFVMAFYLYAMMRLINKYSCDKTFSLLLFVTIGLWHFSMAGLKQTFAMSMMMLAFVYFVERKYLVTVALVVLTYFTHQAALIGVAVFPLFCVRRTKWFIPMAVIICCSIYFYSYYFMEAMVQIMGNEKWNDYLTKESRYSSVTFIFYSVITAVGYLNFKNYNKMQPDSAKFFLGLSVIACGMQLFSSMSASLFRLAFLYTPFVMIALPNSVYYSSPPLKDMSKIFLIASVILYFLFTGRMSPYEFC